MILGAALWLVALATSDVNAQASHEYDTLNCSMYQKVDNQAANPLDCRTFYSCDETNGGKLTKCAEGTLYNPNAGFCTAGVDCPIWYQTANCQVNQASTMNFKAQCCNTYFKYNCATRSVEFLYCNAGTYFSGSDGGSCIPQNPGNCTENCHLLQTPPNKDRCLDTNMIQVSACEFKKKGFDQVMHCADGTAFNSTLCTCVHDINRVCPKEPVIYGCSTKMTYNPTTQQFEKNPVNVFQEYRFQGSPLKLWYLQWSDLFYTPFVLRLKIRLDQQTSQGALLISPSDPNCDTLQLIVTLQNNQMIVMLRLGVQQNQAITASGPFNSAGQQFTVVIIIDPQVPRFEVTVNGATLSNPANINLLQAWSQLPHKNARLCLTNVGPFNGYVSDLFFWRNCINPSIFT